MVENLNFSTTVRLRKALALIADSAPFKPNISELSQKIGVSRDFFVKLLNLLENAGLILMVRQSGAPTGHLTKPEKIYLENTDLLFALTTENLVNRGTLRETFFTNQLIQNYRAEIPKAGDFVINGKFTIEIGGRNRSPKQIAGIENSYLALDDIEMGHQNRIPLWIFGFLY
jgi:predicted AAA+ superfamily ATPase